LCLWATSSRRHCNLSSFTAAFSTSNTSMSKKSPSTERVAVAGDAVAGVMMILSPAKTLDLAHLDDANKPNNIPESSLWTAPDCNLEQSRRLARAMKKRSQADLEKLLKLSANLAKTSHQVCIIMYEINVLAS